MDESLDPANQRSSPVADRSQRNTEEGGEDDYREDFIVAHRLEDRLRHHVRDEVLQVERGGRDAACGGYRRQRQVQPDARMKEGDDDQPERQRDQGREDEPQQRAEADAAESGNVAHVRDPGDQGREDQRRDDHLDQAQKQRGDDAQIIGDRLEARGGLRCAVVDGGVDRPAGNDAEDQRDQDVTGQPRRHSHSLEDARHKPLARVPSSFTGAERLG